MRTIEAVQKVRYAHRDRAIGDQFQATPAHAQALVLVGKAKYLEGEDSLGATPAPKRPGRPKKSEAA